MPVILTDPIAANRTVVLQRNILEDFETLGIADDPLNPYINATQDDTYSFWRQGGSAITRARKSGGLFNATASACGISGHNLGTTGSRVYVLYSDDGTTWLNATPPYDPLTDDDLFFIFPRSTHTYWEVSFGLSVNARVSNVKIGDRLDFPCTPVVGYRPTHHSRKYTKYFNNSMEGHLLGNRVMSSGGTTSVEFPEIPRSFVDNGLRDFEDAYNRGRTFFYAGWPEGKPQDMAYAWADGEDSMLDVSYTSGDKLATVGFGMSMYYGR